MDIMEKLMASLSQKPLSFSKGEDLEGKVIFKTPNEIVLDLDSKSEGILSTQSIPENLLKDIKVGDKLSCIVVDPENESGQVTLSLSRPQASDQQTKDLSKFAQKYQKGEIYKGKVIKVTQTGVFVDLEPGFGGLIRAKLLKPEETYEVGQEISVILDEIDTEKQKVSLSPVLTSTKGLIYK